MRAPQRLLTRPGPACRWTPLVLRFARYLWAGPASLLGVTLAVLALRGGRLAVVGGVLEAHGPLLGRVLRVAPPFPGGIAAITFGHVVLARDALSLEWTRAHERVHVRQYERWGPGFIPAYLVASAWALARGGHAYCDNVFEREARRGPGTGKEDRHP